MDNRDVSEASVTRPLVRDYPTPGKFNPVVPRKQIHECSFLGTMLFVNVVYALDSDFLNPCKQ